MCHARQKRLKRGDLAMYAMLSREWIGQEMNRGKGRVSYQQKLPLLRSE